MDGPPARTGPSVPAGAMSGELIALLWRLSTASLLGRNEPPEPVEG